MALAQALERRRRRTEHIVFPGRGGTQRLRSLDRDTLDMCELWTFDAQKDQARVGRIADLAPRRQLGLGERREVVRCSGLQAVVAWLQGLYEHAARALSAPGPPGDLRQQLK